jgi:hypothetical protein
MIFLSKAKDFDFKELGWVRLMSVMALLSYRDSFTDIIGSEL